jgi:hypothetical protein
MLPLNTPDDSVSITSSTSSNAENQCIICIQTLKDNLKKLNCGHEFHLNCITEWLNHKNTCPMCRKIHTEFNPIKESITSQPQIERTRLRSTTVNPEDQTIPLTGNYCKNKKFILYLTTFVLLLLLHIGSSIYSNYVTYLANVKIDNLILELNLTENSEFNKRNSSLTILKTQSILDLIYFVIHIMLNILAFKHKCCRSPSSTSCSIPIFSTFIIMNLIFHGIYYAETVDYVTNPLLNLYIDKTYIYNVKASFILFHLLFLINAIIGTISFTKMLKIIKDYHR